MGFLSGLGGFAKSASTAASMIPAVYRPRPVIITLYYPSTTLGPNFGQKNKMKIQFELSEVTAVRQSTSADVAVFNGTTQATIQPWYFKPMEITIEGKSNMGIFDPGIFSVNVGNDADIEKILTLRDAIQSVFLNSEAANKNEFYATLEYGATDNDLKRTVKQELRGHIAGIDINEEEGTPYIKSYTIKFIGEFLTAFNIKRGASGRKSDAQSAKDRIDEVGIDAFSKELQAKATLSPAKTEMISGKSPEPSTVAEQNIATAQNNEIQHRRETASAIDRTKMPTGGDVDRLVKKDVTYPASGKPR